MDEIEFNRATVELASLIDKLDDARHQQILRLVLRMLNGMNDRLLELQMEEDDE